MSPWTTGLKQSLVHILHHCTAAQVPFSRNNIKHFAVGIEASLFNVMCWVRKYIKEGTISIFISANATAKLHLHFFKQLLSHFSTETRDSRF
jgi:hypothetical protein